MAPNLFNDLLKCSSILHPLHNRCLVFTGFSLFGHFYRREFQKSDSRRKAIEVAEKVLVPFMDHQQLRLAIFPVTFGELANLYRVEGELHKALASCVKARNLWADITDEEDRTTKKLQKIISRLLDEISRWFACQHWLWSLLWLRTCTLLRHLWNSFKDKRINSWFLNGWREKRMAKEKHWHWIWRNLNVKLVQYSNNLLNICGHLSAASRTRRYWSSRWLIQKLIEPRSAHKSCPENQMISKFWSLKSEVCNLETKFEMTH